ncbi:hypothetical protein KAW48_03640, partial [candidate division WOR-3 bacterium]|nr:hypothetical protein [candidate division WOR-3 bacterium]
MDKGVKNLNLKIFSIILHRHPSYPFAPNLISILQYNSINYYYHYHWYLAKLHKYVTDIYAKLEGVKS